MTFLFQIWLHRLRKGNTGSLKERIRRQLSSLPVVSAESGHLTTLSYTMHFNRIAVRTATKLLVVSKGNYLNYYFSDRYSFLWCLRLLF